MGAAQPTRQRQQRHRAARCRIRGGVRWGQLSPPDRGSRHRAACCRIRGGVRWGQLSPPDRGSRDTVPPAAGSEAGSDGGSSAHQTEAAETPCCPLQGRGETGQMGTAHQTMSDGDSVSPKPGTNHGRLAPGRSRDARGIHWRRLGRGGERIHNVNFLLIIKAIISTEYQNS